ncbi:MAG: thiamine phosphate synthase [Cyanophyceae cyanobacterium]
MNEQYRYKESPAVKRILDANLDRAREGLRIIEEWCRFGLNDAPMAAQCKQMRQELASWHRLEFRMARDTPGDPGTALTHPQEEQRGSIEQLLQANFCRVEEALRVLEEYGKLESSRMGMACKQMRYQMYVLEGQVLHNRHRQLQDAQLYLVTSPSDQLMTVVEGALQGGLSLVQYRDKTADDEVRFEQAQALCQLCHRYGALFIVNDRLDVALAVNADGVHLGQQDLPIAAAKQLLGPRCIVGRSTTNPEEMERAIAGGADYIGVGPVYETPTKVGKPAAGLEYVHYAANHASVPWFAIGGIDADNINEVLAAGAQRIAVVRAIMQSDQPTLVSQYLIAQLRQQRQ